MQEGDFKLLEKGSNSEIFLYRQTLVLKMVDVRHTKQSQHLKNEFALMSRLNHAHVLRCHNLRQDVAMRGTASTQTGCRRNILLIDYADGGSLLAYLQREKPQLPARTLMVGQLLKALHYLHVQQSIAHRDLKLDNVLVQLRKGTPHLLISDFGFALKGTKGQATQTANSYKGTKRGYMAPELHKLTEQQKPYDAYKVDIFSMAVALFAILFNKLPFEYATANDKYYSLLVQGKQDAFWLKHKISRESSQNFPMLPDFQQLFVSMTAEQPEDRPSIERILEDEWVKQNCFEKCSSD